jgi:hypothetical protein
MQGLIHHGGSLFDTIWVKIDFSKLLKISALDVWKLDPPKRIQLSIAAGATRG